MQLYKESSLTKSNLGRLIAAQRYWNNGWYHREAVFSLWAEELVAMPDMTMLAVFLQNHRFGAKEVEHLASLGLAEHFLNALQRMSPGLTLYAAAPNAVLTARQPMIVVKASYIEAQVRSIPILYFMQSATGLPLCYECIAAQDESGNWHADSTNLPSILNFEESDWLQPIFIGGKYAADLRS